MTTSKGPSSLKSGIRIKYSMSSWQDSNKLTVVSGWFQKTKNLAPVDVFKSSCTQENISSLTLKFNSAFGLEYNKRWFVCDFTIKLLTYAESPRSKRVTLIPFHTLRNADRISDPLKLTKAKNGWLNGLVFHTKDRSYEIWSASPQERDRWLMALSKAVDISRAIQAKALSKQIAIGSSINQFNETPIHSQIGLADPNDLGSGTLLQGGRIVRLEDNDN